MNSRYPAKSWKKAIVKRIAVKEQINLMRRVVNLGSSKASRMRNKYVGYERNHAESKFIAPEILVLA